MAGTLLFYDRPSVQRLRWIGGLQPVLIDRRVTHGIFFSIIKTNYVITIILLNLLRIHNSKNNLIY